MYMNKHKVFISYHHHLDQDYKDYLEELNEEHQIFINQSVKLGEIDDSLSTETIREKIRDEYLQDSSVLILLVGLETKNRKHIDWEIYSSMRDSKKKKKSGILVINLPTINCKYYTAAHGEGEKSLYPSTTWVSINDREEYEQRYPYMSDRIIDNLLTHKSFISVINWDDIVNNPEKLRYLIDLTFQDKDKAEYDLSRPMKGKNSSNNSTNSIFQNLFQMEP